MQYLHTLEKLIDKKIQEEEKRLSKTGKIKSSIKPKKIIKNIDLSEIKKSTITDVEILRLQQLLSLQKSTEQQKEPTKSQIAKTRKQFPPKRIYEVDIDPLWYLVRGPLIFIPLERLPHLSLDDLVEFYRAYPRLRWSKYPRLESMIRAKLSDWERENLRKFEEYQRDRKRFNERMYRNYHFLFGNEGDIERKKMSLRELIDKTRQLEDTKFNFYRIAWMLLSYFGRWWFIRYIWKMILFAFKPWSD